MHGREMIDIEPICGQDMRMAAYDLGGHANHTQLARNLRKRESDLRSVPQPNVSPFLLDRVESSGRLLAISSRELPMVERAPDVLSDDSAFAEIRSKMRTTCIERSHRA
jgi:hypothetical protein